MREISSKEYAEVVEDTTSDLLEAALGAAFMYVMKKLKCFADESELQAAKDDMIAAFQMGCGATWRDQAIELFELYGLDVRPDGKDW